MAVTVIIPALNEEESIGQVLSEIPTSVVDEVIVVDGGSTDRTVAIAQASGAMQTRRVVHRSRTVENVMMGRSEKERDSLRTYPGTERKVALARASGPGRCVRMGPSDTTVGSMEGAAVSRGRSVPPPHPPQPRRLTCPTPPP